MPNGPWCPRPPPPTRPWRSLRCGMASWTPMREPDTGAAIGSFVALGDSFTEGLEDPAPDGGLIGWADRVAAVLADQVPGFTYANLAIRGTCSATTSGSSLPRMARLAYVNLAIRGKLLPEVEAEQVPRA